jgi:enediyne biosynthesis protein E4
MSYPYRYGINSLLLNDHGKKFPDAEFVLGVEPRKDLYAPWFEIDCSSRRRDKRRRN